MSEGRAHLLGLVAGAITLLPRQLQPSKHTTQLLPQVLLCPLLSSGSCLGSCLLCWSCKLIHWLWFNSKGCNTPQSAFEGRMHGNASCCNHGDLQRALHTIQGITCLIHDDDELSTQSMQNVFGSGLAMFLVLVCRTEHTALIRIMNRF